MSYKSPTNKQEYWKIVDTYWDDIFRILNIYLPTFSNKWIDETPLDKTLGEYIIDLKESNNPRIVRAFNAAWFAAPDSVGIWDHSGWGALCDLCSEEWCLYEEKESEDDYID